MIDSHNDQLDFEITQSLKNEKMMVQLNDYFESIVSTLGIKVGDRQIIETLINEEALLFAKY